MVRILFIRHGMTVGNLASAKMAIRVAKGQVRGEDAHEIERSESFALGFSEGSGDTSLSDYKGGGVEEAQRLGEYWCKILQGKVDAGEAHVFVSPMIRCQQTADPLMQKLRTTATIQPLIMELPGLCAPDDRIFLDEVIWPLFEAGKDKEAQAKMLQHQWTRCGATKKEIQTNFPWAERFNSVTEDERWWKGMWERPRETTERIHAAEKWLLGLAKTLPEDDVVLLFSHGDTIWRLLSSLVGIDATGEGTAIEHATANTSISSVKVTQRPEGSGEGSGGSEFYVQLDFYNRTPHLGERNEEFYKFNGLMKRPPSKSKSKSKQIDLSEGMREDRLRAKEFFAKL